MPYRIDLDAPPDHAMEALIELGALDIDASPQGLAALMPDAVDPALVADALEGVQVRVSPAHGRDDASVWTLIPPTVRLRSFVIVPAGPPVPLGGLAMADGDAFGTGLHPTTRLCLEFIEDLCDSGAPERILDVGTGSGILALAALRLGIPKAVGLDLDRNALWVAAGNAQLNGLGDRLSLVLGGLDAVRGAWPLVIANIRAGELIEMSSALVRRVAHGGRLALSGIPESAAAEVSTAYRRLGMRWIDSRGRDGWSMLVFAPTW